ncbi:unnamed protein product [Adineta ricciae]|uniref:Uncharacterized protein n=1 Tax=Adineta ricciae TaxID=249248 RepID=A0A815RMP0_ADIRI|nr:unnamed protein product [Adineta ricciae]
MSDQSASVAFNLSIKGTTIQPGPISSRPSSARSNSQQHQQQQTTPSREGSAKERKPSISSSVNLSKARQRRLSNSSQRSLTASPQIHERKSSRSSTASSVFHVLTPRRHQAESFFTEQSQQKSVEGKSDDGDDWDETRRWVNELDQTNLSVPSEQHHPQDVGPLGMSRDSLNGTITGAAFFQPIDHQREQHVSPFGSVNIDNRTTPVERPLSSSRQSHQDESRIEIEESKPEEQSAVFEQEKLPENEPKLPRVPSATATPREEKRNASANNSRRSSTSSVARSRRTPRQSPLPPSVHIDENIRSVSSASASTSSSTSTLTSKVTLDDVYESLKKLEEVEQFPVRPQLQDDSIYLIDPSASAPPPFIDDLPLHISHHTNSALSNRDETNQYDIIVASVRSKKSSTHRTPSPSPRTARSIASSQSNRRQHPVKVVQSVSLPHNRMSSTIEQRIKGTKPYISLMADTSSRSHHEDELRTSNFFQDSVENTRQSRLEHESNQRQPLVQSYRYERATQRNLDRDLEVQKSEYEATIQRHLNFIDQLMEDKRKISERCEFLVNELKSIDAKYRDQIRLLEESQKVEMQKLKDVHEAAEKLRRERWIEEKTKKIKELTVRGLEPEIQKLISNHKAELSKMKAINDAELLAADERAAQRYIRMTEELRDQLEREKEVAIARERELAREKYEKSLRDEEKSYNEQKHRLYAEIEEEKNRQADIAAKQRADIDKLRRDIEENHRRVVEVNKREYESIRLEQEQRYANEIQSLKEKLEIEKQNWEENYMKQQETFFASKERQLREQMKQERDREIEKIITRFEAETSSTKEEAERTADNRVNRLRDKYETDIHELENSERQMKERYNQIKVQLTEVEGDRDRLQIILKQKETEIVDIKKITDSLQQERERLSDIIRQEFADRLVLTDDENRRIKGEIAELRARQQLELEKKNEEVQTLKQTHDKEIQSIQDRIKEAVAQKDEKVHELHVKYETALKRTQHLEGLLAQQQKLLSTVPTSVRNAARKVQPS